MSIANTAQAEHWNSGEGVAHWIRNQARYDRVHAPFTALILDTAATADSLVAFQAAVKPALIPQNSTGRNGA